MGERLLLKLENPFGDAISRVRFAQQSNHLLISSWDMRLRLYDVDGSLLKLDVRSNAALLDCCFGGESVALSAGCDGYIRRYDLNSGVFDAFGCHDDVITCVCYSDETCQLISAGLDKMIKSMDLRSMRVVESSIDVGEEIDSISLLGFDLIVAAGASMTLFDVRKLHGPVHLRKSQIDVGIRCVTFSSYCKGFAAGLVDGRVALGVVTSLNSIETSYMFHCHPKMVPGRIHLVPVNDIIFHPQFNNAFVTGDNDGHVIAWDATRKRKLCEFTRCPIGVASLSCSRGGDILAIASSYTYQESNESGEKLGLGLGVGLGWSLVAAMTYAGPCGRGKWAHKFLYRKLMVFVLGHLPLAVPVSRFLLFSLEKVHHMRISSLPPGGVGVFGKLL